MARCKSGLCGVLTFTIGIGAMLPPFTPLEVRPPSTFAPAPSVPGSCWFVIGVDTCDITCDDFLFNAGQWNRDANAGTLCEDRAIDLARRCRVDSHPVHFNPPSPSPPPSPHSPPSPPSPHHLSHRPRPRRKYPRSLPSLLCGQSGHGGRHNADSGSSRRRAPKQQ